LPTNLPRPRVRQKRSVFSVAFNSFLVGSALFLTFMVVVQEERYAMGRPGILAGALTQLTLQGVAGETGAPAPAD
jgi:uncharacterized membrane protein YdcZ (DUF606 family)